VAELYVPGLDLPTGLAVDAGDREVWEWRRKGHSGDGTLVCLECYLGADRPGGPLVVPWCREGGSGALASRTSRIPRAWRPLVGTVTRRAPGTGGSSSD
jgi:hypothetical protein